MLATGGIPAALWFLGLWYAAPLLQARQSLPDRLRDGTILGVAIPFGLGLVHALTAPVAWAMLAACCVARAIVRGPRERSTGKPPGPLEGAAFMLVPAGAVVLSWDQLVTPLRGGDSMVYHLPNAAAWVTSGSVWETITRYWWYPPGSELFAAGLFSVAGPFPLVWCGLVPGVLFGTRLAAWAREGAVSPWVGAAAALATLALFPLRVQLATLDNDIWLAVFFVEVFWAMRRGPSAGAQTFALCALIKPFGIVYALGAAVAARGRPLALALGCIPLALWVGHDLLLAPHAMIPIASTAFAPWPTTVAAHFPAAGEELIDTVRAQGWWLVLLLAAGLVGCAVPRARTAGIMGTVAAAAFVVTPFAYAWGGDPHTAIDLRFLDPALAFDAVAFVELASLFPLGFLVVGLYFAARGISIEQRVAQPLANDAIALWALLALVLAAIPSSAWRRAFSLAALVAALGVAAGEAGAQPVAYYEQAMRDRGRPTHLFTWLADQHPARVITMDFEVGFVNVIDPSAQAGNGLDPVECAQSRAFGAVLVALRRKVLSRPMDAAHRAIIASCGRELYADDNAVVIAPR